NDEDTIRAADYVLDLGPGAGELGGHLVAVGTPDEIIANPQSLTGQYLSGARRIPVPANRRRGNGQALTIHDPTEHNLKGMAVTIPLGTFTAVTGGTHARLRAGPLLVQRQGRALRGLPGRRPGEDRDALPARRLRHLRRLQGQALQPRDAGRPLQRREHRRGPRHDGAGSPEVL